MSTAQDAGISGDIWLMLPDGSEHALRCDVTIGRGEENDDVQGVYANFDIPEQVLAAVTS